MSNTNKIPNNDSNQKPPDGELAGKQDGELDRIQKQLYAQAESTEMAARHDEIQQLGIRRKRLPAEQPQGIFDEKSVTFKKVAEEQARRRRKAIGIGITVLVLVILFSAAIAATLWYRQRQTVKDEQIKVEITAPASFTSGEEITYAIKYGNDSYVDWSNAEVLFQPPPGFTFVSSSKEGRQDGQQYLVLVGALKSGEEGKIEIKGLLIGEREASLVAKSEVSFTPQNLPSAKFSRAALATTTITSVPLDVSVEMATEVARGERTTATLTIVNTSDQSIEGGYVRVLAADGVQFVTEDPQFSPEFSVLDQGWNLPILKPGESISKRLILIVQAQAGEKRTLETTVGIKRSDKTFVQRILTPTISVAATELAIEQVYNDSRDTLAVTPLQSVHGVIKYNNSGTVGIKDVIIRTKIDGEGLDPASLQLSSGGYDTSTKTITWSAATVSQLALLQPGQSGEVSYDFKIKDAMSFAAAKESKNQVLIMTTTIDSPDVSSLRDQTEKIVSNRFVISIASNLLLSAGAYYDDGRIGMPSTGPLPPRVGEQTTYTLRLRAGSALNDVENVRIVAVLPDGVKATGRMIKTAGEITFNERSGEIQWFIPTLEGLTGRTMAPAEAQIQIAITPSENQREQIIPFLNRLTGSAVDTFTDKQLSTEFVEYPNTESAAQGKGEVQ